MVCAGVVGALLGDSRGCARVESAHSGVQQQYVFLQEPKSAFYTLLRFSNEIIFEGSSLLVISVRH